MSSQFPVAAYGATSGLKQHKAFLLHLQLWSSPSAEPPGSTGVTAELEGRVEGGPGSDSWACLSTNSLILKEDGPLVSTSRSILRAQAPVGRASSSPKSTCSVMSHWLKQVVAQPRVRVGGAPRVWTRPGLMPWGPFRWQVTATCHPTWNPES